MDIPIDFEDPCPVTQRAPVAHLSHLVAQTLPPKPVIEELSPDDYVLIED